MTCCCCYDLTVTGGFLQLLILLCLRKRTRNSTNEYVNTDFDKNVYGQCLFNYELQGY